MKLFTGFNKAAKFGERKRQKRKTDKTKALSYYTVSGKKVNPWTILNRNVKAQGSPTKLCALYFEYIYERTAKIRCKILFNSEVIILQISMTKNLFPTQI